MLIAVFNNLPELILGTCWSIVLVWAGRRIERRFGPKLFRKG